MAVAAQASDRLRGVVLEDPGWWDGGTPPTLGAAPDATGSRAPLRSPAWVEWVRSVKSMSPAERHAHAHAERPQYDPETRHNWIDIKVQFNLAVLDATPAGAMRTAPPWRDTVRAITCPILLVTGDPARGGIVTPAVAEEAQRMNPKLRVVNVPEVGHNIHRDNYPPYRDAIAAYLRQALARRTASCEPPSRRAFARRLPGASARADPAGMLASARRRGSKRLARTTAGW